MWILRPIEGLVNDPWKPSYDKAHGFIVRAATEMEARKMVDGMGGDEEKEAKQPWFDRRYSTCKELKPAGKAGLIMMDFNAA